MRLGDLVQYKEDGPTLARHIRNRALVVGLDDSHRQTTVTLLMDNGNIVERVWASHLEVLNETKIK